MIWYILIGVLLALLIFYALGFEIRFTWARTQEELDEKLKQREQEEDDEL